MTQEEITAELHKFLATHHENVECDTCLNVFEDLRNLVAEICEEEMEGTSILSYVRSCVQIADILIEELKGGSK